MINPHLASRANDDADLILRAKEYDASSSPDSWSLLLCEFTSASKPSFYN